jgi:hypothetical protein
MDGATSKDETLRRTREARAAWEAAFASVPRDRLTEPGAAGSWSAKDLQDHLTADMRWLAGQLRANARGELPTAEECYGHAQVPPPGTNMADQEQRNVWRHSIDRERPLAETLANAPRWADALDEAIAALPEGEFARPYTFADHAHIGHLRPAAEDEHGWPLGAIIRSYTDEHYEGHLADLRAWLDGQRPG